MSGRSAKRQSLRTSEVEVVQYMADSLTNREIAERLYIGVETVRTYAKRIYAKLNVSDRMQAGKKARALGQCSPSPVSDVPIGDRICGAGAARRHTHALTL